MGIEPTFSGSQPPALPLGYVHHTLCFQGLPCNARCDPVGVDRSYPLTPRCDCIRPVFKDLTGQGPEPLDGIEPPLGVYKTPALPLCDSGTKAT